MKKEKKSRAQIYKAVKTSNTTSWFTELPSRITLNQHNSIPFPIISAKYLQINLYEKEENYEA